MILMGQVNASGLPDKLPENKIDKFRAVIAAGIHGPVTRTANLSHITDPTSLGVHLYKDITTSDPYRAPRSPKSGSNVTPILFADCEGFGSGIAKANSERTNSIIDTKPRPEDANPNLLFDRPIVSPGYGSQGKEGVELFYARFLYAFSDVVVFVTKEDQRFQDDMQRLLEWAASAVDKSVNHLAQKTLIIVRNMANRHAAEFYNGQFLKQTIFENLRPFWEGSVALADFMRRYNNKHRILQRHIRSNRDFFAVFFQAVDVCYIPDKAKAPMDQIFEQYQKLRTQIDQASEAGQEVRSRSWTQYNIPTLSHLLNRAFDHFRTSEKPFDFYKAARKDNPDPISVSDHVANLLRHMQLSQGKVTKMFPKVLSICLISCALRNFEQAWEPEDIFKRDLRRLCEDGIQKYREKYQNCGFKFEGGLRCIARYPSHEEHCDEKGARISGNFDPSEYQEDSTKTINEIRELFIAIYKNLCADQETPSLPDPAVLLRQREDVFEEFANIWKVTKSNKTCFTCLQSVPDHVLSCGHGYCPNCVKEFGQKSNYYEYGLVMDHCVLCQTEWRDEHRQLIRLKPKCAGVRILTLDGGGVRGIIELALLERLELRVGLNLAIRDLFDLIMGTSTGGIIALGLAMTKHSATEMKTKFTELATATFKLRREGALTIFDPLQITSKTFMLLRIYESIYRTTPLKNGLVRLFGENLNLFSSTQVKQQQRSTRVAVTSTKDTAANRCLITNYNRPDFSSGDDFEREDKDEKEMKVWEAGLATAAAPFYFRPFEKAETMKNYVDGALHANLPIQYALEEMANLWPNFGSETLLDALVSVGTGIQKKDLDIPKILEIGGFKQISMEDMVARQMDGSASGPSPLAMHIAKAADILTASLFFFEPDPFSLADTNFGGSAAAASGRCELKGSIRCRLARNSQELKKLLNIVDGFWKREIKNASPLVSPGLASMSLEDNNWTQVKLKGNWKNRVRTGGAWFNVDCTISTHEPTEMQQVIAVSLLPPKEEEKHYSYKPLPISGFPISFKELQRRAMST
ncbi:hypothetical protein V8E54_009223 [Elaphomyces granulatus]